MREFISVLLFFFFFFFTYSLRCDDWKFRHSANNKQRCVLVKSLWENLGFIPCTSNTCLFKKQPSLLKIIFVIWDRAWKFTSVVALYLTDSFFFFNLAYEFKICYDLNLYEVVNFNARPLKKFMGVDICLPSDKNKTFAICMF